MPADKIASLAESAITEKVFPGCVIGIIKDGERMISPFGHLTYEREAEAVTEDTVYDLASVTKSIPLASLAALCVADGKLDLRKRVREYLPELQNDHDATAEDLLRYRVKGLALSKLRVATFEELRTRVLESGFDGPAGERAYTNLPAFVLGMVIERIMGKSIAELAEKQLFAPLGMRLTTFFPAASDCAPTEIDERGEVRGLPHDESAYLFAKARRSAGHAGLFSTAGDLLIFVEAMLLCRLPEIVTGAEKGLGWEKEAEWMNRIPGSFGKTGFTGTCVAVNREKGIGYVILSNRTYPKRPLHTDAIHLFRREIAAILLA